MPSSAQNDNSLDMVLNYIWCWFVLFLVLKRTLGSIIFFERMCRPMSSIIRGGVVSSCASKHLLLHSTGHSCIPLLDTGAPVRARPPKPGIGKVVAKVSTRERRSASLVFPSSACRECVGGPQIIKIVFRGVLNLRGRPIWLRFRVLRRTDYGFKARCRTAGFGVPGARLWARWD